ncbi:MAG: Ku protein [Clostridia bacterium]|nr:Ku protein [Clostridia bacterium]
MAYSYKGAITFGMVYIPITLSVSIKDNDIGFNMLDKKTMSRVKYKKTCVDCDDKEIKNENIVKGFQYEKDKYVIFDDKDFEKIKSPKDKNITILQFVDLNEIYPIYFDKAYYVNATGGEKAFAVLAEAMESKKKAGIAKTVLGTKETLLLIRAKAGRIFANTLYFFEEVQEAPSVKAVKTTKKELELAVSLINQMSEKFKPEKFKDDYHQKIVKAIKTKIAGKKIVQAKAEVKPTNVINLMEALKLSLAGNKKVKAK